MKIGIVTLFYQNYNYGGQLQAYALTTALNNLGYQAEQIRMVNPPKVKIDRKNKIDNVKISASSLLSKIERKLNTEVILRRKFSLRKNAINRFSELVPHSQRVYAHETVSETNNQYDAFITGSDQVWNPIFTESVRLNDNLLAFARDEKIKLSYAASMGSTSLKKKEEDIFRNLLKRLDGISVREETAKDYLQNICPEKKIEVSVDPVLLLTQDEWNCISVSPEAEKRYLFCYFLSNSIDMRRHTNNVANKMGLKIITLPHMMTNYKKSDSGFGDYHYYNVDPRLFIGLIKNAEFVITDSFHATVFSTIFRKDFLAFKRGFDIEGASIDSRLFDFLRLGQLETRFIKPNEDDINKVLLNNISFEYYDRALSMERERGLRYLTSHLGCRDR